MAAIDFPHIAAGPEIHVSRRTWATCALIPGHFWSFTLGNIAVNILDQSLYNPAVIRCKEQVLNVSRTLDTHLILQVPLDDVRKLREEYMRWYRTVRLCLVIARQRACQ